MEKKKKKNKKEKKQKTRENKGDARLLQLEKVIIVNLDELLEEIENEKIRKKIK